MATMAIRYTVTVLRQHYAPDGGRVTSTAKYEVEHIDLAEALKHVAEQSAEWGWMDRDTVSRFHT
jgi:hypothetical protein